MRYVCTFLLAITGTSQSQDLQELNEQLKKFEDSLNKLQFTLTPQLLPTLERLLQSEKFHKPLDEIQLILTSLIELPPTTNPEHIAIKKIFEYYEEYMNKLEDLDIFNLIQSVGSRFSKFGMSDQNKKLLKGLLQTLNNKVQPLIKKIIELENKHSSLYDALPTSYFTYDIEVFPMTLQRINAALDGNIMMLRNAYNTVSNAFNTLQKKGASLETILEAEEIDELQSFDTYLFYISDIQLLKNWQTMLNNFKKLLEPYKMQEDVEDEYDNLIDILDNLDEHIHNLKSK